MMTHRFLRSPLFVLASSLSMSLAACGDGEVPDLTPGETGTETGNASGTNTDESDPTASESDSEDTTNTPTGTSTGDSTGTQSTGTTDDSGTSSTETGSSDSSGSTDSTTTDETDGTDECVEPQVVCKTGVCCDPDEDCVNGTCLPLCDTGVRCGAGLMECCAAGEICINSTKCEAPGDECTENFDCPAGEYCEMTLGKCLEQIEDLDCEVRPEFFDVRLDHTEWYWRDADVISIPVVADLDGDGKNEVVVSTTGEVGASGINGSIEHGNIVILSGETGKVLRTLDEGGATFGSSGRSTIAIGDVDGDKLPDIIYAGRKSVDNLKVVDGKNDYTGHDTLIHAYSYKKGEYIWTSHQGGANPSGASYTPVKMLIHNGAPTLANLDDDPEAEIVFGASIIDNDGEVVWNQERKGSTFGSPENYAGGISAVADLNDDGTPEIISGRDAWQIKTWQQGAGTGGAALVTVEKYWNADEKNSGVTIGDGYPAVADLDLDGTPEVILVAEGHLVILGADGKLWCGKGSCASAGERTQPYELPGTPSASMSDQVNYGGPPTVADFDGDGRPEVGVADYAYYAVYDFNRTIKGVGEAIPSTAIPSAASLKAGDIFTRWRAPTQDLSSSATGSSVFDFQGDGAAEVVYGDECEIHVYDGKTGNALVDVANSSATIHEFPVIADVDGDGKTELLVVANSLDNGTGQECGTRLSGVYLYGDLRENWVPTRKVWTQHAYHVTNADSAGNPPLVESNNWEDLGLNNYRQNTQGYGVFNAPDLQVQLSADLSMCSEERVLLVALVRNAGARGVEAGIELNFYEGKNSSGKQIAYEVTTEPLLPGAWTAVTVSIPAKKGKVLPDFYVYVDGNGHDLGDVTECLEDNNDDGLSGVLCPAE